jgi:hypothetical protein
MPVTTYTIVRGWGPEGVVTHEGRGDRWYKDPAKWEAVFFNGKFMHMREIKDRSWPVVRCIDLALNRFKQALANVRKRIVTI